jgi:hypothetical protein
MPAMIPRGFATAIVAVAVALASAGAATANDLPPELVGRFTRQVQPLLVNKCAAGACHGGPAAHAPKFERGPTSGALDRRFTLANLDVFLDTVGTDRDPRRLVTLLAATHPAAPQKGASQTAAQKGALTATPLSARERATIETWLAAVRSAEMGRRLDPAVRQASAQVELAARPNPFRDLLDTVSNPPDLPPPQEPQGVIFKKDDDSAPEPPIVPSPP